MLPLAGQLLRLNGHRRSRSSHPAHRDRALPLPQVILDHLATLTEPQSRTVLRAQLRVNNNRLGDTLVELERRGKVRRTPSGWMLATPDKTGQAALFP